MSIAETATSKPALIAIRHGPRVDPGDEDQRASQAAHADDMRVYRRSVLRTRVRFGQPATRLTFRASSLDAPYGLHDPIALQLATARRLLACGAGVGERALAEQFFALFNRHALRVQADRAHETHVAQERVR